MCEFIEKVVWYNGFFVFGGYTLYTKLKLSVLIVIIKDVVARAMFVG